MAFFDQVAKVAVGITDNVFAYSATWTPANADPITAQVKYKDMSGEAKLADNKYGVDKWTIEYTDSDFPGLKDFINANGKANITVNVRGTNIAYVGIIANALSDGMCTEVRMRLKPS
jgi:hypothetical protein